MGQGIPCPILQPEKEIDDPDQPGQKKMVPDYDMSGAAQISRLQDEKGERLNKQVG
jgi:hypothetical protein